jgi:hypothetical protein
MLGVMGSTSPSLPISTRDSTEPVSCDTIPGSCLSQQARRPIANLTNILAALPQGYLIYNSLQTKFERGTATGFT